MSGRKGGEKERGEGKGEEGEGEEARRPGESRGEGGTALEGYVAGSGSCDRVNGIKKTLPTVVA